MPPARGTKGSGQRLANAAKYDAQASGAKRRLTESSTEGHLMNKNPTTLRSPHRPAEWPDDRGRPFPRRRATGAAGGLHVCPECECDLVQPVAWAEAARITGSSMLCCPNCGWSAEACSSDDEVAALEEQLDDGLGTCSRTSSG